MLSSENTFYDIKMASDEILWHKKGWRVGELVAVVFAGEREKIWLGNGNFNTRRCQ